MPEDNGNKIAESLVEVKEDMGLGSEISKTEQLINDQKEKLKILGDKIANFFVTEDVKLDNEQKVALINLIFRFQLGDRVRNKLGEDGFIDCVGIDYRGVIYLVRYPKHEKVWESEMDIKKLNYPIEPKEDRDSSEKVKTDIPQPTERQSDFSPEIG